MSCPPNSITPASGFSSPAIMRSVVVLPQPDGPSNPKNSPRSTSSETSVTACVLSKRFERVLRESSGLGLQALVFLCVLGVSAVKLPRETLTTEAQRTLSLHRETIISYFACESQYPSSATNR